MNIKHLFGKKPATFGDYKSSRHAAVYERIARELHTEPQHVYEIAHGKGVKTYDDRVIWSELVMEKILDF